MAMTDTGPAFPGPTRRPRAADPAGLVGDERLPCGRLVSDAWKQARNHPYDPDPHTTNCPHCQQAIEGLAALDKATRILRTRHPSAQAVADRVISAVRAETRLGPLIPLDDANRELRIAEIPTAKVLRSAADRTHGVRAASCRLTPRGDGTTVDIAVTLAATLDRPLPERGTEVRKAIADAAQRQLGLAVGRIDVKFIAVIGAATPPTAEPSSRNASRP